MNCKQFNLIKLEEVLLSLGHHPTKQNEKEAWYLNPFGTESQASFKLDKKLNLWYLHSEGVGGNNTDFMRKYRNTSIPEILKWAEEQHFSSFQPQTQNDNQKSKKVNGSYQINDIKELQNENLKQYLKTRALSEIVFPLVKEVHFRIGLKNFYAVGFKNNSNGWELRNSFYKGSLVKKDISIVKLNPSQKSENQKKNQQEPKTKVAVFEGFIDALSFVEIQKQFNGDVLVMNSVALLNKTKKHLKNYSEINLFLDNDKSGERCKTEILKSFPEAKDHSKIYSEFKDLNEYLMEQTKRKINTQQPTEINLENQNELEFQNVTEVRETEKANKTAIYQRKR